MRKLTHCQSQILDFAQRNGGGFHIRELHQFRYYERGERLRTTQGKVQRLKKRGTIQMTSPGHYQLV